MKFFFESSLREQSTSERLVAKEVGFDGSKILESYKEYSPYYDVNMREYWMCPMTRKRLVRFGLLSKDGASIIDPDKERMATKAISKQIEAAIYYRDTLVERRRTELLVEASWLKRRLVQELKREDMQSRKRSEST